jgi:hypothetical protein
MGSNRQQRPDEQSLHAFFALAALALLALTPCSALAGESRLESLDAPVAGTDKTYLDLVRTFVPDLAADDMNWRGRNLDADFAERFDLDKEWPDGLALDGVETVAFERAGKKQLAVLFDFGPFSDVPQAPAILALYALEEAPRLLDSLNVGLDRESGFAPPAFLDLGDDTTALLTRSTHWNSSQSYRITSLVLATEGGLKPIDTVLTFSERLCGLSRVQEPAVSVDAAGSHPALRVEVTIREETVEESCDTEPMPSPARTVSATYRLNEKTGTYEPDSDALDELARQNEERF